ncbi:MAG: hypothetical protein WA373_06240 [Burkholderiales bacterium]
MSPATDASLEPAAVLPFPGGHSFRVSGGFLVLLREGREPEVGPATKENTPCHR